MGVLCLVLQRSQDGIYFYTIKGLFKVYIYQAQRKVEISAFLSEKINGLNVVRCAVVFSESCNRDTCCSSIMWYRKSKSSRISRKQKISILLYC